MNICFNDNDPFAEENVSDTENDKNNVIDNDIGDDLDPFGSNSIENNNKVHIRIQQRNGKKCITTIQGLIDIDFKAELKIMKKKCSCNGKYFEDEEFGNIIQLQGDQRFNIKDYLMNKHNYKTDDIIIHGY